MVAIARKGRASNKGNPLLKKLGDPMDRYGLSPDATQSAAEHLVRQVGDRSIDRLKRKIARHEASLKHYSVRVSARQEDIRSRKALIKRLMTLQNGESHVLNANRLSEMIEEFITLMQLPGAMSIEAMTDGDMKLIYHPRVQHDGAIYDFGDWEITFGSADRRQPYMWCTRSGATASWREQAGSQGGYQSTPYFYPTRQYSQWPENHFCLNHRKLQVVGFFNAGDLLEGMLVALEAVSSIGGYEESDYNRTIPEMFNQIQVTKTNSKKKKSRKRTT